MLLTVLFALRIETLPLTSRVFQNARTIRVLLPDGYGEPANATRKYPVMYLNDGQMVFRPLAQEGVEIQSLRLPPIIIVGMDSAGPDRAKEYNGTSYPSFLVDEVMPLIASKYRVAGGPSNTGVGGFSYGGVAALYAAIARPGVFGRLLIESTPLERLMSDAAIFDAWPSRIFLGGGTAEPEVVDVKDYEALAAILRRTVEVNYVMEPGGRHATSFWRGRLSGALEFLFTSPRRP